MRAITYARVATTGQTPGDSPLNVQEQACLDFARAQGWTVVESVQDVASGLSLVRPGIERVRQLLCDGAADVLVTGALDRLARDPREVAAFVDEIEKAGARLEVIAEHFDDRAVRNLVLSVRALANADRREKNRSRPDGDARCA